MKAWVADALKLLEKTLTPPKHELNDLDWKAAISSNNKRLAEHLSAFSNYPGGGVLVFGVNSAGIPYSLDEAYIQNTIGTDGDLTADDRTALRKLASQAADAGY